MCEAGTFPILAAYRLESGEFLWATCDANSDMHSAAAATDDAVWVEHISASREFLKIDARTGEIVGRGDEVNFPADVPDDADWRTQGPPSTADVSILGGQDDELRGVDKQTGDVLWTGVGYPAYDDVWAGDDDTVYLRSWDTTGATQGVTLIAYAIADGSIRWSIPATPDLGEPWHVSDGRLFSLWFDLNVLDTADGHLLWKTSYGAPEPSGFPRMFGAVANDDTVFVSFTSQASGGD